MSFLDHPPPSVARNPGLRPAEEAALTTWPRKDLERRREREAAERRRKPEGAVASGP